MKNNKILTFSFFTLLSVAGIAQETPCPTSEEMRNDFGSLYSAEVIFKKRSLGAIAGITVDFVSASSSGKPAGLQMIKPAKDQLTFKERAGENCIYTAGDDLSLTIKPVGITEDLIREKSSICPTRLIYAMRKGGEKFAFVKEILNAKDGKNIALRRNLRTKQDVVVNITPSDELKKIAEGKASGQGSWTQNIKFKGFESQEGEKVKCLYELGDNNFSLLVKEIK